MVAGGTDISNLSESQRNSLNGLASGFQSYLEFRETIDKRNGEELKQFMELRANYLGTGGYHIYYGDNIVVTSRNIQTISGALIEKELDTNGFSDSYKLLPN